MKRIGAATALEVRATGIQYAFAPCIAVRRSCNLLDYTLSVNYPHLFYKIFLLLVGLPGSKVGPVL